MFNQATIHPRISIMGKRHGLWIGFLLLVSAAVERVLAQESAIHHGVAVPSTVRAINDRSLAFLASTQKEDGTWPGDQNGPAITGICIMAFMASGADPDYGPYAGNIRRALRHLIVNQDAATGYLGGPGRGSMYHHGFALLALSEAYGMVSERLLWQEGEVPAEKRRSLGQALELAVGCALTAQQKNPWGAWRYSPESQDADTTVTGTVLMGLLGAKNAGIAVPNEAVEKALDFFRINTLRDGNVSYLPNQSHGSGITRTAIATLVYAVGKRKDSPEYRAVAESLRRRMDQEVMDHPFYYRYYMAQALFHSDLEAWRVWNGRVVSQLQRWQQEDGSFWSQYGWAYGTGMSVLALALNYRLLPVYER